MIEKYSRIVTSIGQALCQYPQSLVVKCNRTPDTIHINVTAHQSDIGRLIGKKADRIRALQHILKIIGQRDQLNIRIYISDPTKNGTVAVEKSDFVAHQDWDRDEAMTELTHIIASNLLTDIYNLTAISTGPSTTLVLKSQQLLSQETVKAIDNLFRGIGKANGRYLTFEYEHQTV